MMLWILCLYILSLDFTLTDSACTNVLPLSTGTWKTSNRGTWVVNAAGTQLSGFEVIISTVSGPFTVTMSCEDDTSDTDGYILLKSTTTTFAFGSNKNIYACVKFTQSSSSTDAYQYSLGSDPTTLAVGIYERIVLLSTTATFSFATKCTDKSTAAERTHMAIKDGTASSAAITCPTSIQGTFAYSDTSCSSTFLDVCSTLTQFVFNYTVCGDEQFFSAGGVLHCVYSTTSNGYTYLTLYNDDTSPDGTTYFQYVCLVYTTSDTIVTASINPEECFDSSLQTPTSTVHGSGVTRTITNYGNYDSSSSSSSLIWLYVLIAIIIIIIIIVIIILVYCYLKRRKKGQKKSDEESLHPSMDEEQKQSDEEKKTTPKEEVKTTKKEEKKAVKVTIKEEDRTSIDSGIEQEKKYEKQAEKDKKVVIEEKKEEKEKEEGLSDENSNVTDQNENLVEQNDVNEKNDLDKNSNLDESSIAENKTENDEGYTQSDNEIESNKNDDNIDNTNNDQQIEKTENSDDDKDTSKNEKAEDNFDEDKSVNEQNENNTTDVIVSGRPDDDQIVRESEHTNELEQKGVDDKNEIENSEKTENDDPQNEQIEVDRKTESPPETDKKDEKQTRSVKIYETSEWKGDLGHQEKPEELGDKCTDQNPKIIKVKEQEEEKAQEDKDEATENEEQEEEEEGSESEASETSSRITTPDPEEIERNIRKIGMKKTTDFKPQGELSKVLVSRKMEEESRTNKEKGKWKKMKNLFRVKTKKIKDLSQNKAKVNAKGEQQTDSDEEEEKPKTLNNVTPFLEQYNYKKHMEKQLDEQHVWGGEEDYEERLKDSDDEEFANIFKDDNKKDDEKGENEKLEKTQIEMLDLKAKQSKHIKGKVDKERLQEDVTDDEKRLKEKEDQAKDSGVDSPDFKREKTDINYTDNDDEMQETEMTEPPPGFIKDSAGRIIRLYDNKVMTEEEMQSIFPLSKLGMLFHVPRLKRTSHGRPTGEYIEDTFGPKLEQDQEGVNGDSKDDYPKAKHPRSSRGSARREQKEALATKTVAFLDDGQSDILMIDDDYDNMERRPSDANRELLRKRLFRNKRKPRSRGGEKMILSDESRPRELSDLVRIIPQAGQRNGANGRAPVPGTVVSRNDSLKNKYDPEQQQIYREGLAADKKILERSPSVKRPPTVPKQAFTEQDPDDIRISIDNEENEARLRSRNGINIGSDDEFFLVGNKEPEPFFTVRRHDQTTVRPLPGSDMFCPKHDMRHALPWSLINQYHIRESSVLNLNKDKNETTKAPKSADNAKRNIDDRRLRELLEELYKDKKYFDHMIDTTEPNMEPVIDERFLAQHGRDFLLERADYWDERGVRIPRPPQSELALRLSRMQTFVPDSGRVSNISYASTATPQPRPEHLPADKPTEAFQRREHTIS